MYRLCRCTTVGFGPILFGFKVSLRISSTSPMRNQDLFDPGGETKKITRNTNALSTFWYISINSIPQNTTRIVGGRMWSEPEIHFIEWYSYFDDFGVENNLKSLTIFKRFYSASSPLYVLKLGANRIFSTRPDDVSIFLSASSKPVAGFHRPGGF